MSSTRGLVDQHRLEAALERGVLLDVLAVLVERGRADRAQLAAREHRLEQVGGVDGALGGAGADDRVQLVDEQDHRAGGVGDLLEHRLEAVLELAAVLRAGEQRRRGRARRRGGRAASPGRRRRRSAGRGPRRSRSCRRRARRSAPGCSWCGARGSGSTRRIVASRPITGSSLPSGRLGGEVAAEALERLVALLGVLVGDAVGAADLARARRRRRSRVAPAARSASPARPGWAASASSRCSVET